MKFVSSKVVLDKYSEDKSFYKITPKLVAFPKNESEVIEVIKYAKENDLSLTPRGGGTGLSGSALGDGIVIDMSKYFTKVFKVGELTKLQPGILLKKLNPILKKKGYMLPSVPLQEWCAIGGNINTRSIGPRALKYGTMDKQVHSLRGVLADGRILDTSVSVPKDIEGKLLELQNRLFMDKETLNYIKSRPIVAGGYNLLSLIEHSDIKDIVTHLIVGSVGTLMVLTEATLKLPKYKVFKEVYLIHFNDLDNLQKSVNSLIKNGVASIEYAEKDTVKFWDKDFRSEANYTLIASFEDKANINKIVYGYESLSKVKNSKQKILWKSRAKALPSSEKRARKEGLDVPSGIDDTSIDPKYFSSLRRDIEKYSKESKTQITIFGHLGVGSLHLRPLIDMKNNPNKLDKVSMDVFKILRKYNGTLIGEHNSGLCRSRYIEMESPKMYSYMKEVKDIFDPANILNPKVIFNLEPMMKNLKGYK